MVKKNKKPWWRFLSRVLLIASFAVLLYALITYAKGYRPDFSTRTLQSTGIIAVNSYPNAAKVYLKGQDGQETLKGVTSLNLSLPPGIYTVTIKKEGYTSLTKTITLKGELVQPVDALLFPINPSLSPLTNLGLKKAVQIDQTDGILLFTDTETPEKDGVYIFESSKKALSFLPPLTPLLLKKDIPANSLIDFARCDVWFSYDYKQAIIEFALPTEAFAKEGATQKISYLISLSTANQQPFDVTASRDTFLSAWEEEKVKETAKIVEALPKEIRKVASDSFHIVSLSPDETKILYRAKAPNNVPLVINPPLIGSNQSPETRFIELDEHYVYDKKEDKNYKIDITNPTPSPKSQLNNPILNSKFLIQNSPLWYPDSRHFIIQDGDKITVIDYDGVNKQTVYSGPHEKGFIGVNSEGKLLILTNLNPDANKYPDLYSVGIR